MTEGETYMNILRVYTNLVKMPRDSSKATAETLLATIEEYRDEHNRLSGHQQRHLDRMENSCRERLGLPLLKRSLWQRILQKLT